MRINIIISINKLASIKKTFFTLSLLFIGSVVNAQWSPQADYPGCNTQSNYQFVIDGYGYIGSGGGGSNYCNDLYQFDPINNSWTQKANTLVPDISGPISVSYNGKAYVGLGLPSNGGNNILDGFWEYNPISDSWNSLTNCPLSIVNNEFYLECNEQSFVLNGKIYCLLPKYAEVSPNTYNWITETWVYTISTDSWQQLNDFKHLVVSDNIFVVNNVPYLLSSVGTVSNSLDSIYTYNESNDSWSVIPNVVAPQQFALSCGFVINNSFYIGMSINGIFKHFYEFNTTNNTWTQLDDIIDPAVMDEGSAFSINNIGYMGLGDDNVTPDGKNESWNKYTPESTSINENKIYINLTISPNPTTGIFSITADDKINNIVIYSVSGEIVRTITRDFEKIDLSKQPNGLYFVIIETENGILSKRLILE